MTTPSPPPEDPGRFASVALLADLVTNTLDPGYRAAAARRGGNPRRHWADRPLVALGCLLIGFVTVLGYVHTHRDAPETAKVHNGLVARARSAERSADALTTRVTQLQREVAAAQNAALPSSGPAAAQRKQAAVAAGQVAVKGPGLTVTLREPKAANATSQPGRGGTVPIGGTNILTDRDVRSVVNELWADGAEAIAVNGVRLTPTSAIRFAGQAVLVDFQPISSPYRITAIGNADGLSTAFAQSAVASRYQTLSGVDHIGFDFHDSDSLTLPAGAPVTVRHATRAGR
jgi:uncharacterized protein YlxW (UPF0749 family)